MIHTLSGAQAPVKAAGTAVWTSVRIEQSVDNLTFTAAETQLLNPVETDPTNPVPNRIITFESADASLYFRLVWIELDGDESPPSESVLDDGTGLLTEWAPSPEQVAPIVRTRLKNSGGAELATFSTETRPTREQVLELISLASQDVVAQIGTTVPSQLAVAARFLTALGTAMLIELTYFPEQVSSGRSPYDQYERLYNMRMTALIEAAAEIARTGEIIPGDTIGEEGEGSLQYNRPFFAFDDVLQVGQVFW